MMQDTRPRNKGIYLLPNLITTSSLFIGFYSIVSSIHGLFSVAAAAIFIAAIADSLDGRVARLTNTQTQFGAEYDSICDMVSFGVAPAVLAYTWGLKNLGDIGWLIAFIYVLGTGIRLARFNVQTNLHVIDKRYFQGIPCPAAALFLASFIWVLETYSMHNQTAIIAISVASGLMGLIMVSKIRYKSFKDSDFKNPVPHGNILIIALVVVFICLSPAIVLFVLFSLYVLLGIVDTAIFKFKTRNIKSCDISDDDEYSDE